MRERLIELIDRAINDEETSYSNIADYLLENGVIVPPCQKGAVLYRNGEKCEADHWNVILTAFNEEKHVRLFNVEEAENALKKEREKA